jgi:hypothetical protein
MGFALRMWQGYVVEATLHSCTALACAVPASFLWPTLSVPRLGSGGARQLEPMPLRRQLRRLWKVLRCYLAAFGLMCVMWIVVPIVSDAPFTPGVIANLEGNGVLALSCWLSAVLPTAANRGRFIRWLGSLGERGSQAQEAATVASLIGGRSAAEAFTIAGKNFRALPLASLTREHLVDNKPDPTLHALTVSAELGEVAAFVSHSWRDDGEVKFARLHEHGWGTSLPSIWLDKVQNSPPAAHHPSVIRSPPPAPSRRSF